MIDTPAPTGTQTQSTLPQRPANAAVSKEIRFSVVMYGGVSLAIYMNGVTQELLHMVRSTARNSWKNDQSTTFRFVDQPPQSTSDTGCLKSTERIYRQVARKLNRAGDDDVRFIIDVISGTSAGGINGIFLAKALSDDSLNFDVLQSLWVDEGALEWLLNDKLTSEKTNLPVPSPPKSLLCSDRMYIKLLEAFQAMRGKGATCSEPWLSQEIDLFATTTDITGRVVPLRLADMLVWERKHKEDFHFCFNKHHNDFAERNNPFLAFVARCTSSFPFAFEPMQLSKLQELRNSGAWPDDATLTEELLNDWEAQFFDNSEQLSTGPNRTRAFGDGGYLNNKPFSYAVDMLGQRSSSLPTDRKLIYVEPSPEHPEQEAAANIDASNNKTNAPDVLTNSFDALIKLPGYQPIHDDLQRVIERNRLVRKVNELSAIVTAKIYKPDVTEGTTGEGPSRNLTEPGQDIKSVNPDCIGDFSYIVLRVYSTTDDLSAVLAQWFQFVESSSFYYGLRCVVRAWRQSNYEGTHERGAVGDQLAARYLQFLADFDLDYEKRKYMFVRQQINMLYCFDQPALDRLASGFGFFFDRENKEQFDSDKQQFQQALIQLKEPFDTAYGLLSNASRRLGREYQPSPSDSAEEKNDRDRLAEAFHGLQKAVKEFQEENRAMQIDELARDGTGSARGTAAAVTQETDTHGATADSSETPPGKSVIEYVLGVKRQDPQRRNAPLPADVDESYAERSRNVLLDADIRSAVDMTAAALSQIIQRAARDGRAHIQQELSAIRGKLGGSKASSSAIRIVEFFNSHFQLFDAAIYPLVYDTDVGTPELINVIRVSPDDATQIFERSNPGEPQKLAGTSLAHFGAFLDRSFRTNDILWGRLDGAERIIRSLLPTVEHKADADRLIQDAHYTIVSEYLNNRQQELANVIFEVAKSLNIPPGTTSDAQAKAIQESLRATLASLPNRSSEEAVKGFLTTERILEYLRQAPPKREPDHRTTLESLTRSIRIVGGMLEGLGDQTKAAGGFLIRVASALWWLVEAAVPGGLFGHFFRKFFAMLFWFAIVMTIAGTFLRPEMQSLGLKLLGILMFMWIIKDAFRRFILHGGRGPKRSLVFGGATLVAGAVLWVIQYKYGLTVPPQTTMSWLHRAWNVIHSKI